jgi:hypothetical protein
MAGRHRFLVSLRQIFDKLIRQGKIDDGLSSFDWLDRLHTMARSRFRRCPQFVAWLSIAVRDCLSAG